MTRFSKLFIKTNSECTSESPAFSNFCHVSQVFKSSDMNFADFSFCPAPTASQQPEAEKEEQADDKQEQKKKKKKKKVKPPEEGSFAHYEAQSNGGTAIGSADPSLQVS